MFASGTGLAPFRGFLQERAADSGPGLGPSLLIYGCRHPQYDELYVGELGDLATAACVQLEIVYSRDPSRPRMYVQDQVRLMGRQVMDLVDDGAVLYACGQWAMVDGVRATLVGLRQELRGASAEEAEVWMQQLSADRRWVRDLWSSG